MSTYNIHCILPCGRYGRFDDERSAVVFVENAPASINATTFQYVDEKGAIVNLTIEQIEESFHFEYTPYLEYLHERDLRNYAMWAVQECLPSSDALHIATLLNTAFIHNAVVLRHAGENVGHGLFVQDSKIIEKDMLIGEYTGVVSQSSVPCSYSMNYPSTDGGYEIRALERGNIIRFVNHCASPNAVFKPVEHEGIVHIACVRTVNLIVQPFYISQIALREIRGGEQIVVNYGEAYWLAQGVKPALICA